jgi:hypothetical protein
MAAAPIETAFNALNLPVWCIASDSGDVVYANNCARERCGWRTGEQYRGMSMLAAILSLDTDEGKRPITLADISRAADSRVAGETLDGLLQSPGELRRYVTLSAAKISAENDQPRFVLIAITERRASLSHVQQVNGSALSQSVAHELNNIAASLFGFVELAAEQAIADAPLLKCLGEIRLGVARVTDLAAILEALAEYYGKPEKMSIAACIGKEVPVTSGSVEFIWECDPSTTVDADPDRVRTAIRAWAQLASADAEIGSPLIFTISHVRRSRARCFSCRAPIPIPGVQITMTAENVRLLDEHGPLRRRRMGRTLRELIVAGGTHATHTAGGHVLVDAANATVSMVLPAQESPAGATSESQGQVAPAG